MRQNSQITSHKENIVITMAKPRNKDAYLYSDYSIDYWNIYHALNIRKDDSLNWQWRETSAKALKKNGLWNCLGGYKSNLYICPASSMCIEHSEYFLP